jgi:NAD(P)-dependent dehydrogenase (short-subunit alcohol dehydrogenase family)
MTNTIDLRNRNVLVTGGSRGIGAGICRAMAACGANVLVNYHQDEDKGKAESLADQVRDEFNVNAFSFRADISDQEAVLSMYAYMDKSLGGIDILVNNAGTESVDHAIHMDLGEWDRVMNVNLRGSFICAQQAGIRMARKNSGVIINISSMHDKTPRKGLIHYCTAKAGLNMMTKCLALELAEYKVRVLAVSPGAIETEMNREEINAFGRDKFNKWIPLGKVGSIDEVAWCCAFLASDKAGYVTGTTIYIDGAYKESTIPYDLRKDK